MGEIYTSIDLGTDSIKIVVAEKINDKFYTLSTASVESKGIKNGFIVESKEVVSRVKQAIKEIEISLNIKIQKVIATVPSSNAHMDILTGNTNIIDYNEITGEDVSNALMNAVKKVNLKDDELVSAVPIVFSIDDKEDVQDPKGMKGTVLEVKTVVSTVPKEPLYRMLEVLKLSGLETIDICFSSVGDYYNIKNRKYDSLLGAIINIGEEQTNISIFNKGIQIKNATLPVGSINVDKDLTYVFKSKLSESKKIKENFAIALAAYADSGDVYEFQIDKETKKEINQVNTSKVVEARIREILKLAKNEIKNLTNREIRYIMITGGLSEMAGFQNLVESEYGFIGKVCNIQTMGVRHNKFSSCYGIIKYFDDKLSLRGKTYQMVSDEDIKAMLSIDSTITNDNMLSKVFGHFFDI